MGTLIAGWRLFAAGRWSETGQPFGVPVFVVTRSVPEEWPREDAPVPVTFVAGGVQSAVERAHRIRVAEWQVIRRAGEWTAGSGRCGWPGPARPRPVPAGPGTSGSTGRGSSPRMRSGPVMRCGCAKRDANASWSSCGSSPNVPAHLLPPSATSTTVRPFHHARRLSRWLRATAARGVRPSASAVESRSCSGGQPAELVPDRCEDRTAAPGRQTPASAAYRASSPPQLVALPQG